MEVDGDWTCHVLECRRCEQGVSPRGGCPHSWLAGEPGPPPENFEILDDRYLRKMKLLIGLKNAGFLG